jgi:hypothetical protein
MYQKLRRALGLATVAMLAAGALLTIGTPANADYYPLWQVVNRNSGKCLDVDGGGQYDGANVWQWSCVGVLNQFWMRRPFVDGFGHTFYQFVARHSNKCLDVDGGGQYDGANVWQWSCVGVGADGFVGSADDPPYASNQLWYMTQVGYAYDGSYGLQPVWEIHPRHSGKCLDVAGASLYNGANVHQWTCVHEPQQYWILRST